MTERTAPATVESMASKLPPDFPADPAPPNATDSTDAVSEAVRRPYTLTAWREDLAAMREGVETKFPALAEVGMRWQPGRVYSVIARPGAGKTTFLLEACCRYLEADPSRHAVVLSWEEHLADVVTSLLLREDARADSPTGKAFANPVLFPRTVQQWGRRETIDAAFSDRLRTAEQRLAPLLGRLHLIDGDRLGHTAQTVLAALAAWMRETGAPPIGLVAVDYFQKLTGDRERSRQVELQGVADALRRFAKGARLSGELEQADTLAPRYALPVLVGAQVNRTSANRENGTDGHPSGDDIREADDLLNDSAGVIALSWKPTETTATGEEIRTLRLSVPKNRGGAVKADHVAGMLWRPARRFLAPDALGALGRVQWSPLGGDTTGTKPKPAAGSPFVGDPNT